jgi:Ca2+-binding RTX toxin-like protein
MCDRDAKSPLVHNFLNDADSVARLHFSPAQDKWLDAMMLTGHDLVPPQLPTVIITTDTQPGDTSTTATINVGGPHIISSLETVGDQDFYQVQLEAGQAYEIGQYAYVGGPNAVPLPDCYVEIYDSAGNLIVSGDGGASTLLNNLNSGFDVLLSFTPETTGTYYINARAYDQDPVNGTDGDFVGDYELFVQEATGNAYQPYYDPDSPLYAIDWGTQVDGTSRNPDGAEGPRPTGNAFTGAAWNPYGIEGKNVITYYFARQGEIFIDEDPTTPGTTDTIVASGFEDWEKDVYLNAFGAYSKVADLVYVEVQDRTDADFVLITYEGTPGPGVSLLGRMSPPDEENEGRTEFNANDERWTEEGLAPGGFSFNTLIHELGHGHGLAHPHDNGGRSGIMRGVEPDGVAFSYTNGDFDLNQGVYTMMSYEDGWEKSPYGSAETTDPYGWLGSLMAFDVAAIQDKYGVNEAWATGNDTYVLKDANAPGTYYECLWDAGGSADSIVYGGARNANIDLRPATLEYEYGGGGWISYAFGVFGGFTIANGVTIENATSGSGNDTLTGNAAVNVLTSGAGNDTLDGGAGADHMVGGAGDDTYKVDNAGDQVSEALGGGRDTVIASVGFQLRANVDNLTYVGTTVVSLVGNELNNFIDATSTSARVVVNAFGGNDTVRGGSGADTLLGAVGNDILIGNDGNDAMYGDVGGDQLQGGNGEDILFGGAGNDVIWASNGNDQLQGGAGADLMGGGVGADRFYYDQASVDGSMDTIQMFKRSEGDKVALNAIDANTLVAGDQAFAFIGSSAFHNIAGELRLTGSGTTFLAEGDVSGDGVADFSILFQNTAPIGQIDFIL